MYGKRKRMMIMLLKSPWSCDLESLRVKNAMPDDVVVFVQDSVLGATNPPEKFLQLIRDKQTEGVRFYASKNDCQARGLAPIDGVELADYGKIVDLICECELSY
ncbi:MAG TPA: sulfurtransferase complex subunit TusB [Caldisericia bacterium]|nr:sulfurtransferase complex subunit TusB [Caldisericia bacterium]HPF49616.1 sulfurtransferase complex subunit TusB [Caldisericia bacterium]HPI84470.1 sulfurtransferase complex subunit TusB [Caldisericia bacterium]HPQ93836.1 sulfurtransferase complex subunit TusB [Caldisericia bacterium]HRV75379.1 sulfurtransferase complex subunit TusB [Caldisericia bacterium]